MFVWYYLHSCGDIHEERNFSIFTAIVSGLIILLSMRTGQRTTDLSFWDRI